MAKHIGIAIVFSILAAVSQAAPGAAKDESRLLTADQLAQQPPASEPMKLPESDSAAPPPGEDLTNPDAGEPGAAPGEAAPDEMSIGEIPDIKSIELTADLARRAIDSYVLVKAKYADTDLESADNLQDFVDKSPRGKDFEADVKAAGFANVDDWNLAITSLGFAYSGVTDDPTADIKQQIEEITADTSLAQDMKDRMIASLNAMIPSDNNRTVVAEMMKDAVYAEKLKQLEVEEE